MTTTTAFIGLGVMGYPMAGFLSPADYPITVCNRTPARAEALPGEYGGKTVATPGRSCP